MQGLRATLALIVALIVPPCAGNAQSLQHLTITSFTLSTDTARPMREVPFHLVVRVHVTQHIGVLKDLNLPILAALELLGDENGVIQSATGTEYREVITVVSHSSGPIVIQPATLDAIDARDGRAKEYFSNPLTLHIGGSPLQPFRALVTMALVTLKVLFAVFIAGVVLLIAILIVRTRNRRLHSVRRVAVVPQPEALPQRDPHDELQDSYLVLRADPTRAHALVARSIVRRMVGASDDETLGDVMHRKAAAHPALRSALLALERAAFTYQADVHAAISDAVAALEQLIHAE